MKAILINSFDESVSEVDYNGDYKEIYNLIDCDTFDVVPLDDTNDMYVDDEGLLKNPNRYFKYGQRTLAGKGLILAHDDEGESVGTTLNSAEVFENVKFLPEGHTEEPYMEFFEVRS